MFDICFKDGHEPAGSEGAKFRLWVKSKGLTLYPGDESGLLRNDGDDTTLFLPTGTEQVKRRFLSSSSNKKFVSCK